MSSLTQNSWNLKCNGDVNKKIIFDDGMRVITEYGATSEDDLIAIINYHESIWSPWYCNTKCISIDKLDNKWLIKIEHYILDNKSYDK